MPEENEREIVLSILQERAHTKKYSNVLIRQALDAHDAMDQQKKAFVKRLAEGVIEREKELDAVIRAHLKNPRTSIKGTIWLILRMGVYQILYMDSVPDFAAVNESLKLARAHHLAAQTGFLNAVLRSICRDKEQGQKPGEKTVYIAMNGASRRVTRSLNQEEQASLSMPEDIRKIWEEDYGKETEEALSKAMMEIRPVCIRFDPRVSEEKEERRRRQSVPWGQRSSLPTGSRTAGTSQKSLRSQSFPALPRDSLPCRMRAAPLSAWRQAFGG